MLTLLAALVLLALAALGAGLVGAAVGVLTDLLLGYVLRPRSAVARDGYYKPSPARAAHRRRARWYGPRIGAAPVHRRGSRRRRDGAPLESHEPACPRHRGAALWRAWL